MNVDWILDLARDMTYTDDVQITPAKGLMYLNAVYHDIENRIVSDVDEDFFWDSFTLDGDTVVDQNEYEIPKGSATARWISKLDRVEFKYSSTDTYKKLLKSDSINNFQEYSDEYWQNNTTTWNAFVDIRDGSVFIYPKTTEAVTGGLVMYGTYNLIDLVWGWAETTIFPTNQELRGFHDVLAIGVTKYINKHKGDLNAKNDSVAEYEREVERMLSSIRDRMRLPYEPVEPSNYNLMY